MRGASFTLALSLLTAPWTRAQERGLALSTFNPAERGSAWLQGDSLTFVSRPTFGVVAEWARRPLVLLDDDGRVLAEVVRQQAFVHLGASLAPIPALRLAFNLPVHVAAAGETVLSRGSVYERPAAAPNLGDLRVSADYLVFERDDRTARVAVGVEAFAPTGARAAYASDGVFRIGPRVGLAGDAGPFAYAARVGALTRTSPIQYAGLEVANTLHASVSAGLRALDGRLLVGPELFAQTLVSAREFAPPGGTLLEALFGAHYTHDAVWTFHIGGSAGVREGLGSPRWRAVAGLEWRWEERAAVGGDAIAGATTEARAADAMPTETDASGAP